AADAVVRLRPHDRDVGDPAVRDPHLAPFRTQSAPSRLAFVFIDDGSLPESGSVRPKQPISSPAAMPGSHRSFCSSDPNFQIGNIASEPWTETKLRSPLSAASSSRQATP